MDRLDTRPLLAGQDVDRLARVMANLLEEVIELSERVHRLEGKVEGDPQARIDAIIRRVLAPL